MSDYKVFNDIGEERSGEELYEDNVVLSKEIDMWKTKYNEVYDENKKLKEQYCERTDCGGRLGNSEKVEELIKENEILNHNWNELKKWINDLGTEKINEFGEKGKIVAIWNYVLLDKIQKLEEGENNE